MSGYFRDRYQGVGAIAAAAPAPRSAPAPSFGRMARTGGRCFPGCIDTGTMCDCDVSVGGRAGASAMARTAVARARRPGRWHMTGMGAVRVMDDGSGAPGGGTRPPAPTPTRKSPLRAIMPGVLAPPVRPPAPPAPPVLTASTGVGPAATLSAQVTSVAPPPSPGYLPPRIPVKASTAGGGAGYPGSPAYTPPSLNTMAPPDSGPDIDVPEGSAMTGGLPGGAAKIWIALGLGAAAFFGYRHFKKRRRR